MDELQLSIYREQDTHDGEIVWFRAKRGSYEIEWRIHPLGGLYHGCGYDHDEWVKYSKIENFPPTLRALYDEVTTMTDIKDRINALIVEDAESWITWAQRIKEERQLSDDDIEWH